MMFDAFHAVPALPAQRSTETGVPLVRDMTRPTLTDEEILQQRAREYSRPRKSEDATRSHELEVLAIRLGTDDYAIPCDEVDEVVPLQNLVSLPNTPRGIIGLSSNRGVLFAVLDPKPHLQVPGTNITTMHRVVILRHSTLRIGVLVDSVLGMSGIDPDTVCPVPTFVAAEKRKFIPGITADRMLLIDVPRFLEAVQSTHPD
jgi:purine-binding chemotaxis protein CheW